MGKTPQHHPPTNSPSGHAGSGHDAGHHSPFHLHGGLTRNLLTGAPTLEGALGLDMGFGTLNAFGGLAMAPDLHSGFGYHPEAVAGLGFNMPLGNSNFDLNAFVEGSMGLDSDLMHGHPHFGMMGGLGLTYNFGGGGGH